MQATSEKLATVLTDLGLSAMAEAARAGRYDDFRSDSPTPIGDLVRDLLAQRTASNAAAIDAVVSQAQLGAFDGTRHEANAWAEQQGDPKLAALLKGLASP